MSRFKVVTQAVTGDAGDYSHEMEALSEVDAEIIEIPSGDEDALIAAAREADALYGKPGAPIGRRVIEQLDRCRIIALGFVGADTVDVGAATDRGIPVRNVPDTFIEEVADHVMLLLLASFRRLPVQDRMARGGQWTEARPILSRLPRLMGQTLGFVCFGHVPRAVARRAHGFGLRMLAYDPYVSELELPPYGVQPATLPEVLRQADFVSLHAPATPAVTHMLGAEHFRQMKPEAIFINAGRGATMDEAALIEALQEGRIAGAALDVLETEPPRPDNPLLRMDNVIITAHVASASARFDPGRKRRVGREIALVLSGQMPMSCVNPRVLPDSGLGRWQPVPMVRGPNS